MVETVTRSCRNICIVWSDGGFGLPSLMIVALFVFSLPVADITIGRQAVGWGLGRYNPGHPQVLSSDKTQA